jgi:hypothetical protein
VGFVANRLTGDNRSYISDPMGDGNLRIGSNRNGSLEDHVMAEATNTTRRSLLAISAGLAFSPAFQVEAAPGSSIEALNRALNRQIENYPWDAAQAGSAWATEVMRLECAIADAPCDGPRAAAIKLRQLILPTCHSGASSHLDESAVVEDILRWLER